MGVRPWPILWPLWSLVWGRHLAEGQGVWTQ